MKFLKIFLAALLAVVVGSVLSGLVWVMVIIGAAGSMQMQQPTTITSSSVLKIDLAENIVDAPSVNPLAGIDFMKMQQTNSLTLFEALRAIETAKNDERIKALYINFTGAGSTSVTILEELRAAILDFKQSGKPVVAYNEVYSQMGYYFASVADKVYLQPEGSIEWAGLSFSSLFFKSALDKLGIKAEAFRPTVCKYKSAVEPYILNEMSPANRRQMQELCDNMWTEIRAAIAESRGLECTTLNSLAETLEITQPEDAVKHRFVDELLYEDQVLTKFDEMGLERNLKGDVNFVSLGEYAAQVQIDIKSLTAPQVGIIYANGQILDGAGEDDNVYSANLVELLKKARKDENIKAVVLRVNSPGGSALASDVMWREIELLKAVKPVVVSMGSMAASGGYYISAPADVILCDKMTLTGSIGVFGMFLVGEDLFEDKLGISIDGVKSNRSSDFGQRVMGVVLRKPTEVERRKLIRSVDKVYDTFTKRVSDGRNLSREQVYEIAEGRVWSGVQAVKIGLADAHGGLKEALAVAADKAGIKDNFRITEVLGELTPFAAMMQSMKGKVRSAMLDDMSLAILKEREMLQRELNRTGVQAYCPLYINIE